MKKLMNIFVLVAAAAMTLASCQKNEIDGPVKQEVHFTINAGIAETKTIITDNGDGTYTPSWRNEDKIGIFFTEPTEKVSKVEAEFSNTKEDGETASFEGTASVEGEGTFYAFYPSSAFNQHYGDGTIRLDLPASQKPTSTSFDPACDILVAQPCGYIADGETVVIDNLYFARLMSVLRVNLVGEYAKDQIVESFSVEVDVNANVDITGNAKVDYKNATISAWNNGNVNRNVVTATYTNEEYITIAGTNHAAYLVVAPVTIPSGTTLTFTIETENYDIVKTVTAPANMVMPAGNIAVINLTIAEENCTPKVEDTSDYSGEYLIVNTDLTKAASKWANGNNLPAVALNAVDGVVYESDNLTDCKMTITKITEGENLGCYTIQDASNRYLYAASTSANRLNARQEASYWDITEKDGIYTIKSKENTTRNWMRFNNSDNIFNCYSSGQQDITLYKYSDIQVDDTPSISLTKNSDEVTYDATSYEFTYTTKNIAGNVVATIKEGATMANVSASASNGTVTVNFDANADAEQKTATIILSYEGATSQEFVLTQAGKAASGTVVDVLTRATSGVTGTSYTAWSGKTSNSEAVYAGQSAGGNDAIQLRTTNSNSGVVTTTSGGKVKKIKVTWQSATTSGRTLDIYGKNTAYTAATDLYSTSTQGTKLGSIQYGTSTELEISGDYEYIGLRSNSGAMYLTEIEITWETNSGSGSGETPDPGAGETPDPETPDETKYYVKVTTSTPGAGTYLYVLDKGFVFTGDVSDNSWGKSEAVTITDNKIEATEAINAYAITLEEGTTSGQYAVKLPNGNYLVTTTQKPTSSSTASYMTYDTTEGLCSVNNSDYYFHGNTSSNSFRWYKLSSNQNAGQLYKLN